jgi:fructose-bisphosphate aldolase class II
VLHLDHAEDFAVIKRAIEHGFTSVMFDGSHLPLTENIRVTREVSIYAHARGVAVEAELGFVAGNDMDGNDQGSGRLTDPKEVEEFVAKTEVDALAVSIGTAHGVYRSRPVLDLGRLAEIMAVTAVPLVLHGGSGTPEDQLGQAIEGGITKLNIYADMRLAMNSAAAKVATVVEKRQDELPDRVLAPFYQALREEAEKKLVLTRSLNRY